MNRVLAVLILLTALGVPSFAQYTGRLSADDQKEFDKYYKKWVDDTRRNDRDDIASDVRHMQDIMVRNQIPSDVPFDRIASTGGAGYDNDRFGNVKKQNGRRPEKKLIGPGLGRGAEEFRDSEVENLRQHQVSKPEGARQSCFRGGRQRSGYSGMAGE